MGSFWLLEAQQAVQLGQHALQAVRLRRPRHGATCVCGPWSKGNTGTGGSWSGVQQCPTKVDPDMGGRATASTGEVGMRMPRVALGWMALTGGQCSATRCSAAAGGRSTSCCNQALTLERGTSLQLATTRVSTTPVVD